MPYRFADEEGRVRRTSDTLRSWIMVALAIIFTLLYAAALTGWVKPLGDERIVTHLEAIIFVIIGYYFGRAPSQQNERTLKDDVHRQTMKADAAQAAKEQAQRTAEMLEEKVRNARAALSIAPPSDLGVGRGEEFAGQGTPVKSDYLRHSVMAALNVLNS